MGKKKQPSGSKRPVTVFLDQEEYDLLTQICKARRQTRADFLRASIQVHEQVPMLDTRKLQGACLQKHLTKLEREKREKQRAGKG